MKGEEYRNGDDSHTSWGADHTPVGEQHRFIARIIELYISPDLFKAQVLVNSSSGVNCVYSKHFKEPGRKPSGEVEGAYTAVRD